MVSRIWWHGGTHILSGCEWCLEKPLMYTLFVTPSKKVGPWPSSSSESDEVSWIGSVGISAGRFVATRTPSSPGPPPGNIKVSAESSSESQKPETSSGLRSWSKCGSTSSLSLSLSSISWSSWESAGESGDLEACSCTPPSATETATLSLSSPQSYRKCKYRVENKTSVGLPMVWL